MPFVKIKLGVTGENAAKRLQTAEKTFHFVAAFVQFHVVLLRFDAVTFRRNDRLQALLHRQSADGIAFVGLVHLQGQVLIAKLLRQLRNQLAAFRIVGGLAGRKLKHNRRGFVGYDYMNLRVPSAATFADGL